MALLFCVGATDSAAPADAAAIERLAWLGGCWAAEGAEPGSGEHWLPLAGGTLPGVSRTVRRGRTVEHEFMQIREGDDGRIAFIAQPSGPAMARFPVLRLTDDEVVFQNPEHGVPQRIVYRRESAGRMHGCIEGLRGGTLRTVDFPMRRVSCDAPLPAAR